MIARGVRLDVHWCVLSGVGDREREAAAQFPLGSHPVNHPVVKLHAIDPPVLPFAPVRAIAESW